MTLWHYTTSHTVAADLKVGDWMLVGDECLKVLAIHPPEHPNERNIVRYTHAYGDGVSVENDHETWDHQLPSDHVVTLIHFTERDA